MAGVQRFTSSTGGDEIVVAGRLVLDSVELCFECDSGCTQDVADVRPGL